MPRETSSPHSQIRREPHKDRGPKGLRTRARILAEAKQLLLEKGYDATTIGEIADASGIRRASFYTYFAGKDDVLLAIGRHSREAGIVAAQGLLRLNHDSTIDDVTQWVEEYLAFWDEHGSFVYAVLQAAYTNQRLRARSVYAEMQVARIFGQAITQLRDGTVPDGVDPLVQGLAIQSMIERLYYHWCVSRAPLQRSRIARSLAHLIWTSGHAEQD